MKSPRSQIPVYKNEPNASSWRVAFLSEGSGSQHGPANGEALHLEKRRRPDASLPAEIHVKQPSDPFASLHIQSTRSPALPGSVWRLDHRAVGVTHVYPSVNKQEICGETLKDVTWKGQWLYLFVLLLAFILFSWHEFSWRMPYWTCPTARVALVLFFYHPLLI